MSRLIEALRKAEEEKRKGKKSDKESSGSQQPQENLERRSEPDATEAQSDPESNHSVDFELEPTEAPTYTTSGNTSNPEPVDNPGASIPLDKDTLESQNQGIESVSSPEALRDLTRRQTDTIQADVMPGVDTEPAKATKRKFIWILLVVLLLLILAGTYFLFFYGKNENQYPASNSYSQNRGFLDATRVLEAPGTKEISSSAPTESKPVPQEKSEQGIIDTTQNIIESTVDAVNQNTVDALSAINDLISNEGSAADEVVAPPQDNGVIQIKRSKPISGSSSSLAYAKDNVQGGEHEAARMEYKELLRNQPTNRSALLGLAKLEAKTGNRTFAKQLYSKLLQLNPNDPIAELGFLENTYHSSKLFYESQLKTLASKHSGSAFIQFKLGSLLASQSRWSEAKNAFEVAHQTAHKQSDTSISPDYAFNLAVALEKTQNSSLALDKYLEARELSKVIAPSFDSSILDSRIRALKESM